ncbi:MAG: hypothetical protein KBF88_16220 [Polyangiaceae bacterium]|nr:hypothetical protein [Polyangiaceae bacterium]
MDRTKSIELEKTPLVQEPTNGDASSPVHAIVSTDRPDAHSTLSSSPFAMDIEFRTNYARALISQVDSERWAAFIPAEGILSRDSACVSLGETDNGGIHNASVDRTCSLWKFERRDTASILQMTVRDLRAQDRDRYDGRISCEVDRCKMPAGEMSWGGTLVFAREGAFVRLVSIESDCGGALGEETRAEIDRLNRRLLSDPPPCPRPRRAGY